MLLTKPRTDSSIFERRESSVRRYCRSFPQTFHRAEGSFLFDEDGERHIDFLTGSGSLNYGHNDPHMAAALTQAVARGAMTMALDFYTPEKAAFLEAFEAKILAPRGLSHKVQFVGPTGTNAVEAAMKLARKVTGRTRTLSFTNAFHGCTAGAMAATGNKTTRRASEAILSHASIAPYDGYMGGGEAAFVERALADPSSGFADVGAVLFEPIQGEGGFNAASAGWARTIVEAARAHGALVIVDECQSGCGRTGDFFAFEGLGIEPDLVILAKSISGFGLPMALLLVREDLDVWEPGEHSGTFRGNTLGFVTGTVALERYWSDQDLSRQVTAKAALVADRLDALAAAYGGERRGRGLMQGLALDGQRANAVQQACARRRLVVETCGPMGEVIKLLPALTIEEETLEEGLSIIEAGLERNAGEKR